jgi:hypothetical protein
MRGVGVGVEQTVAQTRLWAAAVVGVGVAWAFSEHVALWVEAQAAIALQAPEFVIQNAGTLHRAAVAAPRVLLGLEARFW